MRQKSKEDTHTHTPTINPSYPHTHPYPHTHRPHTHPLIPTHPYPHAHTNIHARDTHTHTYTHTHTHIDYVKQWCTACRISLSQNWNKRSVCALLPFALRIVRCCQQAVLAVLTDVKKCKTLHFLHKYSIYFYRFQNLHMDILIYLCQINSST